MKHSKPVKNTNKKSHYKNLVAVSAISLLFIVTCSSVNKDVFGDQEKSNQHIPHWSALLGVLLAAVMVKCSLIGFLGYRLSFILSIVGFVVSLLFYFKPTLPLLTLATFIEGKLIFIN